MSEEHIPTNFNVEQGYKAYDRIKDTSMMAPLHLRGIDPRYIEEGTFSFNNHFNVDLADDSDYFKALKNVFVCVKKHTDSGIDDSQMDKAC